MNVAAMTHSATVASGSCGPRSGPSPRCVSGASVTPSRVMLLEIVQHARPPARQSLGKLRQHAPDFAGARHRTLKPADRAEIALDPFAHHRLGGLPHVELGIEAARHALDHHHGLLQQHQFGPRPHVEQAGDLEQQRQQLRHRDFFGGAIVDRLADGADRLREILDRMMGRHIAGLEMHFGDAAIVAGDEAERISARKRRSFGPSRPMMPKSTATSRPASSTNRLPGCMSAWKKPSRSAWRRKLWITLRPRAGRSTCAARAAHGR